MSVGSNHSRLGNTCLQVVADDRFGNPAKVRQGLGLPFDPIGQLLTEARVREGERRGPQHRDKNLRLAHLARLRIDHLNRLAGVIGLHHRTCIVAVAEGRMRPALVGAELLAEPGVAVTIGMGGAIFLPQQRQRHALALEFLRHISPIRLAQVPRRPAHAAEQHPPQSRIARVIRRQRPAQPRLARSPQISRNRSLAEPQPFRDRPH